MRTASANGLRIAYDDRGPRSEQVLLFLPGWCVNRSFFDPLAERLSAARRVVTLDWRGHGDSERPVGDFGHEELVADALAVIDACGARSVVPVAQAHGGWVALELRRRLGDHVPRIIATSWLVLDPPPPFGGVLEALQDRGRWQEARDRLFSMWVKDAPAALADRVRTEMGAYGFDTWANAGRAIAGEFARQGSALRALSAMAAPPSFLHLFSQPRADDYLEAQRAFARDNPWFEVRRLDAVSHFPALEIPDATAQAIASFV
jgi:pimeloyl-ACP methyl ester carboxylesterase